MSRRYGRNQKRKAQALLEAVKEESKLTEQRYLAHAASLERRTRSIASGYEVILELISNTLGPSALMRVLATGELPVIKSERLTPSGVPHRKFEPPERMDLCNPSAEPCNDMVNVHELYDLICEFRGSFEGQLVAKVQYRSGMSCLTLNEQALKACPSRTMVIKIATELEQHLRKQI